MPQRAPEPVRKRHGEAPLGTAEYEVRNDPADGPPEQPLTLLGGNPQVPGYAQGEVDEVGVEKRHARLERDGHAGPVDLGENVPGEIRLEIETHHQRRKILRLLVRLKAVELLVYRAPAGGVPIRCDATFIDPNRLNHARRITPEPRATEIDQPIATGKGMRQHQPEGRHQPRRASTLSPTAPQRFAVTSVSAEQLVPAITRKRNRH